MAKAVRRVRARWQLAGTSKAECLAKWRRFCLVNTRKQRYLWLVVLFLND